MSLFFLFAAERAAIENCLLRDDTLVDASKNAQLDCHIYYARKGAVFCFPASQRKAKRIKNLCVLCASAVNGLPNGSQKLRNTPLASPPAAEPSGRRFLNLERSAPQTERRDCVKCSSNSCKAGVILKPRLRGAHFMFSGPRWTPITLPCTRTSWKPWRMGG